MSTSSRRSLQGREGGEKNSREVTVNYCHAQISRRKPSGKGYGPDQQARKRGRGGNEFREEMGKRKKTPRKVISSSG